MKKILTAIMATISILTANAQIKMYAEDVVGEAGKTVEIAVKMTNDVEITSWQMNLVLPEGFTVAIDPDDEEELLVTLATERTTAKKHNAFDTSINSEGELFITCASTSNKTYAVGDGDICYITLNVAPEVAAGDYTLTIKNPVMTKAGTNESLYPGNSDFLVSITNATGIAAHNPASNSAAYNLQGQRVRDNAKGIVVKDGKKICVK